MLHGILLAGLLRVLDSQVVEILLVAIRPEVQGLGLGRLFLRHIEAVLIRYQAL